MVKAYLFTENPEINHRINRMLTEKDINLYYDYMFDKEKLEDDLQRIKPHVIITDIKIRNNEIPDKLREFLYISKNYKIIVILNKAGYISLFNGIKDKIHGFLCFKGFIDEIYYAIKLVHSNDYYLSSEIQRFLSNNTEDTEENLRTKYNALSFEYLIAFHQLIETQKLESLAGALSVSTKTALKIKRKIFGIFEVENQYELCKIAE